ncbi:hypothetical protein FNT36_17130 [Hymenobacter setariae]|uniref:Uncharacterized protein n=1 Tax=Hymenobacter setariae TaxID=2594794 RepID=A0A558BS89_9BACT|nr:hypothetical protein [Hymenobacter setariae]TVT39378.1 hypothetical protein FNT36_17130 [Hymenobacter setariae]
MAHKSLSYWVGAIVALCLGWYVVSNEFFDGDDIRSLGGGYYTANYDEGTALHWHKDPEKFADEPLLDKVYDTQRNDSYVVARAGINFYFAFPLRASSLAEVQQNRLGPFSRSELDRKMVQLTGDSALRPVGRF